MVWEGREVISQHHAVCSPTYIYAKFLYAGTPGSDYRHYGLTHIQSLDMHERCLTELLGSVCLTVQCTQIMYAVGWCMCFLRSGTRKEGVRLFLSLSDIELHSKNGVIQSFASFAGYWFDGPFVGGEWDAKKKKTLTLHWGGRKRVHPTVSNLEKVVSRGYKLWLEEVWRSTAISRLIQQGVYIFHLMSRVFPWPSRICLQHQPKRECRNRVKSAILLLNMQRPQTTHNC